MPKTPSYEALKKRLYELEQESIACKRIDEAFKESEARYRLLVHDSPLGILTIDTSGRITVINGKTLEILGWPSEETAQDINVFGFPAMVESGIASDFRRCLEKGQPITADRPYFRTGKSQVHLRYHLRPIIDRNGRITGVQSVQEDFTRLKHAEDEIRKTQQHLEELVRERTTELTAANEKLTRLVRKLEAHTREMILLNQLSELLQSCDTEEETYCVVNSISQRLFPADRGYLGILDNNERIMRIKSSWGEPFSGDPEFDVNQCWAIRRGKVHYVQNPKIDPLCPHLKDHPLHGCMCVPMSAQGEVLGMMHLCLGVERMETLDEDDRKRLESKGILLVSIVERYAPSLTSLRLRETLRIQSIHDPLTNLYNRRYMESSLDREVRRAKRHGTELGIIIMDVDHFKRFNDSHGHEAGDMVLRELGVFLQKYIRGEDIACRYGGEEFTLILPEASLENTVKRAEEMRLGVREELRISHQGRTHQITISLGVSVFPDHGRTAEETLNAADIALYRAKTEGRDQVVVASLPAWHSPPLPPELSK